MYRNSSKKAFTLIELLVVIAIIAILAAILFPVFAKVREKARQTMCLSNEKQMGIATLQYVQDYDECYPLGQTLNSGGGGLWDWTVAISPYVKAGQLNGGFSAVQAIWSCPSFPLEPIGGNLEQGQYHAMETVFMDYGNNASGKHRPCTSNDLDKPADQVMIYEGGLEGPQGLEPSWAPPTARGLQAATDYPDACWVGWDDCSGNDGATALASDCDNFTNHAWAKIMWWVHVDGEMCGFFPRYRHNGVCNMLFADGHAKGILRGRLSYNNNILLLAGHDCGSGAPHPWCPLAF